MGTMVAANRAGLNFLPVQADQAFIYPDQAFWHDLRAGKIVASDDLASVEEVYKSLFVLITVNFSSWGSQTIQTTEVQEMAVRLRKASSKLRRLASDGSGNKESVK